MLHVHRALRVTVCLALLLSASACTVKYRHEVEKPGTPASWKESMDGWIRYDGYDDVAGDLQVAVADYTKEGEPTIKMVGVIHMGDADYYAKLQRILDGTDLVLYEGVRLGSAPEGTVDPGTKLMWATMSDLLGLTGQVEAIDYNRPHWRQADMITDVMSAEERPSVMPKEVMEPILRGLDDLNSYKSQLGQVMDLRRMEDAMKHGYALSMAMEGGDPEEGMRQLAEQLAELRRAVEEANRQLRSPILDKVEEVLRGLEENFRKLGEVIITERNEYVIDELGKELEKAYEKAEDRPDVIAVFYGAGHMPDFHDRLAKLGYEKGEMQYLNAWLMNSR